LIQSGFVNQATELMDKFKSEHEQLHQTDINSIYSIKTPAQLNENEIAQNFRKIKQTVRISSFSLELIISYLIENKFNLILSILAHYIDIRVLPGPPNENAHLEYTALTGISEEINDEPILWGLLPELVPKELETPEEPDKPDEPQQKKRKLFENIDFETIASKIPLPKPNEETVLKYREDLQKAVPANANQLPSICCYTFLNTYRNLNTIELSKDCSMAAAGFSDSLIKLWDVDQCHSTLFGTVLQAPDGSEKRGDGSYEILPGHSGPIFSLAFSPDSNFLLSASEDSTIRLWSMETRTNLVCYKAHTCAVWDVDFSPLGYYFASASHDRTARLWSTDHIFPLRVFAGHLSDVDCVKFHPNCNYLATGSSDNSVRLWELKSGECVRLFTAHSGAIYALAFSPDGRFLASAGEDGNINIWDLPSGKRVKCLTGHHSTIWSLSFSQEGTLLASGSADMSVKLWEIDKAALLYTKPPDKMHGVKKVTNSSPELVKSFSTLQTPIYSVKFTNRNLLMASGVFIKDP